MTVKCNYTTAITTQSNRLKNLDPVFSTNEKEKPNSIGHCALNVSSALSKSQVLVRNSVWFITLFAPVKIGCSNYFGIAFSIVIKKHSKYNFCRCND